MKVVPVLSAKEKSIAKMTTWGKILKSDFRNQIFSENANRNYWAYFLDRYIIYLSKRVNSILDFY